jgi:ParB-like chromosome segregation protein Spo0J
MENVIADMITLDKIVVKDNIRQDYGQIEDLGHSILENGLRKPIELNQGDDELVDGFRRVRAVNWLNEQAKAGQLSYPKFLEKGHGLEIKDNQIVAVQFTRSIGQDKTLSQIIYGISSKSLTPVEQAQSFQAYMKAHKLKPQEMAVQLGKSVKFIHRRLRLLQLSPEAQDALNAGKIEVGHAELLGQLTPAQQKTAVKEIQTYDLTVQNFSDQLRWMEKLDFGELEFRPEHRSGSETQKVLDIGYELDPLHSNGGGSMRNSPAFKAEVAKYVESQRELLRKKGILVFSSEEKVRKKYPKASKVNYWNNPLYARAIKALPTGKDYAVVVDINYSGLNKEIYVLEPKQEKEKAKNEKPLTEKQKKEAEKLLATQRLEKLNNRVNEHMTTFLRNLEPALLKNGSKELKTLVVYALIRENHYCMTEEHEKWLKSQGIDRRYYNLSFDKLYALDESVLDEAIFRISQSWIPELYGRELTEFAGLVQVDLERDFVITKEFLELHTKDQLQGLIAELKLPKTDKVKKSELVTYILAQDTKGKVPKSVQGFLKSHNKQGGGG